MILQVVVWLFVAVVGGVTASIAGFGIGSLLTPVLATRFSVADAILAVSIPHAVATAVRCWRLRKAIDWTVLRGFGIASAIGGILGAFALFQFEDQARVILGVLLIATGAAGLTGWNRKVTPSGFVSTLLGGLSGLFGGLAGNQGGLRAAALLSYRLTPATFVATSTAVGLMVDAARLPVYMTRGSGRLLDLLFPMAIATIGVLMGTLIGEKILLRLSRERFTRIVSVLITALGIWLLTEAIR
jgi:uncharacterized membrane protein YfcA